MVTIHKRKLTDTEAAILVSALRDTPNITGYSQEEWLKFSDVWVGQVDGHFAGVAVNEDFGTYWTYMTALFVRPEYQGKGLGKELFDTLLTAVRECKHGAYTCSRNPVVIKWMKSSGMSLSSTLWSAPLPILFYYLTFYISLYRIREFLRKSKKYKNEPKWVYGRVRF